MLDSFDAVGPVAALAFSEIIIVLAIDAALIRHSGAYEAVSGNLLGSRLGSSVCGSQ